MYILFFLKHKFKFSCWSQLNNKSNGPSLIEKCTICVLLENNVSVIIITMNIYSYNTVKTYLTLYNLFFYYCSQRVHFSRLSILIFVSIFIMENGFLIYLSNSLKLSVILKTKCKRDHICINPTSWLLFICNGVVL